MAEPLCVRCVITRRERSPVNGKVRCWWSAAGRVIPEFFNPPGRADFDSRHMYRARQPGRESAKIIAAQCDLMTGLYARDGLKQMHSCRPDDPRRCLRAITPIFCKDWVARTRA